MARKRTPRDEELSGRAKIAKRLDEIHAEVEQGFQDQRERSDDQLDYWDAYNCILGDRQYYDGNAKIFVPIIHNAVDARKTRFTNQLFPKSGRYVEAVTENGDVPQAETALLEHYVRKARLRTKVAPALNRNGDIEGQYNVYVDWHSTARHVVWAKDKPIEIDGVEHPGVEEIESLEEDIVADEYPDVEVLSDADVSVQPATADSVDEALDAGGHVAIVRRWSKAKIKQLKKDGKITAAAAEAILGGMQKAERTGRSDIKKEHADAAGVKDKGKWYMAYEVWARLKVDGVMRLTRAYMGGGDQKVLGCKLNPFWCDRCPLISWPVEKVAGVQKGISKVKPVCELQYFANDIINEGADSATFAMLPITMTDPLKNPKISTMVIDLGAVWETNPNDTKFATLPHMWKDAVEVAGTLKAEIFQTLSVNPAMMPQSTGGKAKRSQAEIANEQAVDILTTADAVTAQEEGIWTPIIERFAEYDAQFRSREISVRAFGQFGRRLAMEKIPPLQMGKRYEFRWFGVEAARNAAQVQQMIAGLNVLRGIPPQMLAGRRINMVPIVEQFCSDTFGPRLAPLVFEDMRGQLSVDPETENRMLADGFDVPVSPYDNDPAHIQAHLDAAKAGDPTGRIRVHIMAHQMALAAKAGMQAQAEGQPGSPGGSGPGIAGQPRPGGQVAVPRQNKQPAGAIPPDSMGKAGAVTMPRKM